MQQEVRVSFCRLRPHDGEDLDLPQYHSELAAGMDIEADVAGAVTLDPGERLLIPTGFAASIPAGYEIQVRPRSGLAIKHGVTVINAPGTIDADYRGEIKVGLVNLGDAPYTIHRRDRIAQLVVAPVCRAIVAEVAELDSTKRQTGGFGHTGK
ncbi:MAG: dUTP diphosphatase [Proteobacteria bacterium]|nr:dUTP diphosphatase [Pseudomonadota bacterium]MBU1737634.1 dUTP diphosphatase [Pseudomonadota bacterium]